jgi:hypothetical protein
VPQRPLQAYAGEYAADGYGEIRFTEEGGRLRYEWGVLRGIAVLADPAAERFLVTVGGNGTDAVFSVAADGRATSVLVMGTTFMRARPER